MSTRRDRILTLLHNYLDVENGLQDRAFRGDDFIPRMCRAWSHPSYVELRRLIAELQSVDTICFNALADTYFRFSERRVSFCPRCRQTNHASKEGEIHRHGQVSIRTVPKVVRVQRYVDRQQLDDAIDYLEQNFRGEPFVPDDLLAFVA